MAKITATRFVDVNNETYRLTVNSDGYAKVEQKITTKHLAIVGRDQSGWPIEEDMTAISWNTAGQMKLNDGNAESMKKLNEKMSASSKEDLIALMNMVLFKIQRVSWKG